MFLNLDKPSNYPEIFTHPITAEGCMKKIESVIKRNGAIVPFNPDRITNAVYRAAVAVGGRDKTIAEGLTQKVVKWLEETLAGGESPTVEQIQDVVEKVLIENKHARVAKAFILYRADRIRSREQAVRSSSTPAPNIPWAKIWNILDWAVENGVNTIQGFNEKVAKGELPLIVEASEAAYAEDIMNAAKMIAERKDAVRIVFITGPSSSGKTTSTMKVGEHLKKHGLKLVTLNVDHYFFDLEKHPKDEFGDYDFETPQALDLDLINQHLVRLTKGEEVLIPFYDFKTGHRFDDRTPMKLSKGDLILIDSLHGLFPAMTKDLPEEQKFKLYLEPLLQMKDQDGNYVRWTDIRLMRRMLRDAAFRAYDPEQTLLHWHYVRSSEMRNIVPFHHTANYIINSAMPYELSVYKPKLENRFAQWVDKYADDPLRADAFERAVRCNSLLQKLAALEDDSFVPKDSVIREFIGGSILNY
jgi:uridine kinase